MRLVRGLRVHLDEGVVVLFHLDRIRPAGLPLGHVAEQLLCALVQVVADLPADADDHAGRPVPVVDVAVERVAVRVPDRLLAADDVPAERLVAVEELLVHAADEVARRVVVHVHLLDDHAFLTLDLVGVELGVAEHVDEHVERDVARLRGALDVVAGVLLAGESVELAADRVDLHGDVAGGRPALRPLEEHVLREVRDAVRLGRLVARPGSEHDRARHRLRRVHRRGQDAQPVVEPFEVVTHGGDATEADPPCGRRSGRPASRVDRGALVVDEPPASPISCTAENQVGLDFRRLLRPGDPEPVGRGERLLQAETGARLRRLVVRNTSTPTPGLAPASASGVAE